MRSKVSFHLYPSNFSRKVRNFTLTQTGQSKNFNQAARVYSDPKPTPPHHGYGSAQLNFTVGYQTPDRSVLRKIFCYTNLPIEILQMFV